MISNERAREYASWWHGGQGSALYAFASSGYIDVEELIREICSCITIANLPDYTADDRHQLDSLYEYVRSAIVDGKAGN